MKLGYTALILAALSLMACGHGQRKADMHPTMMTTAQATQLVKPFYDFLGGDATPAQVQPSYHANWVSYFDNERGRSMAETAGFVSGPLAKMIPDLKWTIKKVYVTPNNTIIVRGEATGTPAGNTFMGTPIPGGKSFKFMSIDIHELKDGKILKTYHVEDWIGAIRQITAK
jgi:predicted ester cyclase